MGNIFSIMTTIDFNKLDAEIAEYKMRTGCWNPYIFMSEDTIRAIENELPTTNYKDSNRKGVEGTYTGHKVFVNNDLKLGVVEIR